ncbi:MAG: tRNA preQ1(34) S-adenosylmethionine ribosyltransferase-isomerase QueA [Bacteriovoracaceae bacterium]
MNDYQLSSYDYDLPPELIAERPVPDRHSSRLLVYNEGTGEVTHSTFRDLANFLPAHSTLIFNRSRVFPCRLLGKKMTGGEAEVFLLTVHPKNGTYEALIRTTGKKKVGDTFHFGELSARIEEINPQSTFQVSFNVSESGLVDVLEKIGKVPIPPYIRDGESDEEDKRTYQTVYAKETGSVAAPTAGLHFSPELLKDLENKGHTLASVTLHVGMGTFAKIKVDNILEHKMHEEVYTIDAENLSRIKSATFKIAVGTTSLRTLESYERSGNASDATSIFLHPGVEVKSIDALITNFHLPKSSLLMLVSALIGREKTLELYQIAVKEKYRFYSYGDGMLILRKPRA